MQSQQAEVDATPIRAKTAVVRAAALSPQFDMTPGNFPAQVCKNACVCVCAYVRACVRACLRACMSVTQYAGGGQ